MARPVAASLSAVGLIVLRRPGLGRLSAAPGWSRHLWSSLAAACAMDKAGADVVVVDGMEGDKVKEPGSLFYGKRMKNGWKN